MKLVSFPFSLSAEDNPSLELEKIRQVTSEK
jgi:hypothetical protein